MTEAMWVFPGTAKVDVILPDGTHRYWSTWCRHGDVPGNHEQCGSGTIVRTTVDGGRQVVVTKSRATCKTCDAPCLCSCHNRSEEQVSG